MCVVTARWIKQLLRGRVWSWWQSRESGWQGVVPEHSLRNVFLVKEITFLKFGTSCCLFHDKAQILRQLPYTGFSLCRTQYSDFTCWLTVCSPTQKPGDAPKQCCSPIIVPNGSLTPVRPPLLHKINILFKKPSAVLPAIRLAKQKFISHTCRLWIAYWQWTSTPLAHQHTF